MNKNSPRGLAFSTACALALCASSPQTTIAQDGPELPRPSPLSRVEQDVGVTNFAVEYYSPGVKGRTIWGSLVPYDELWRTGANRSTQLEASHDFTFAGESVAAGAYSLFTIPGEKAWTVILNSDTDLSGTRGYDKKKDVARVTVTPERMAKRERMTFLFAETTNDATRLDLEWDELRLSIPLQVDTNAHVAANIEDTLANAWRPHFSSARWLLDNDGDLTTAIDYIDTSIGIKSTWWNHWIRAQILAKQGDSSSAIKAAETSQKLGKGDAVYDGFFRANIEKAIAGWKK